MKNLALLLVALTISGCASRGAVIPTGPGTYMVNTRATWELGGLAGARTMALEEATKHCVSQGRNLRVLDSREAYEHFSGGTIGLTFACDPK